MKKNAGFDVIKRIMAVVLCAFIFVGYTPPLSFAESEDHNSPEIIEEIQESVVQVEAIPDESTDDADELLMGYLNKEVSDYSVTTGSRKLRAKSAPRGNRLEGINKKIYDSLKAQFTEFADPETDSIKTDSFFRVSAEDLFGRQLETKVIYAQRPGSEQAEYLTVYLLTDEEHRQIRNVNSNQGAIMESLMVDMPYELFWFDKTARYMIAGYNLTSYTLDSGEFGYLELPYVEADLSVSKDYSADGQTGTNDFDLNKINSVKNTVSTVNNLVATAQSSEQYNTDYKKLEFYKNSICNLTGYDHNTSSKKYGDPWQLIYVFDGREDTNVVCEGYSKAFQFLCDKSTFSNTKLNVFTVTGEMVGYNEADKIAGAGAHMWNIIQMPDGNNYLADITNSDSGMMGENGTLFMAAAMSGGSISNGYDFECTGDNTRDVFYKYDSETTNLYSETELAISKSPCALGHSYGAWTSHDENQHVRICANNEAHKEFGNHTWDEGTVTTKPTETEKGIRTYTCTVCKYPKTESIPSELDEAKEKAKAEIEAINAGNYSGSEKAAVEKAKKEALDAIEKANSVSNVNDVAQSAKEIIAKQKTDKVKQDEAKKAAEAEAARKAAEARKNGIIDRKLPRVSIQGPSKAKRAFTAKWKKLSKKNQKKVHGIEIQVATNGAFTKGVMLRTAKKTKTSLKVKKLRSKGTYWVRIRTYKKVGGTKYVSYWSKARKVKVK